MFLHIYLVHIEYFYEECSHNDKYDRDVFSNNEHSFAAKVPSNVNVIFLVLRVAEFNVPVLIKGETSTGKECVEKYIHQAAVGEASPYFR